MPKFVVFLRAIQNIAWIAKADQYHSLIIIFFKSDDLILDVRE